jgi:hypothetical protein
MFAKSEEKLTQRRKDAKKIRSPDQFRKITKASATRLSLPNVLSSAKRPQRNPLIIGQPSPSHLRYSPFSWRLNCLPFAALREFFSSFLVLRMTPLRQSGKKTD